MSSIVYGLAKADTLKKEVLSFSNFEKTVLLYIKTILIMERKFEVFGGNYGESNEENGNYNTIVADNILLNILAKYRMQHAKKC